MRKIRWIKPISGGGTPRREGNVEVNDDDLCARWVSLGLASYVDEDVAPRGEDVPLHRAVQSPKSDKKRGG